MGPENWCPGLGVGAKQKIPGFTLRGAQFPAEPGGAPIFPEARGFEKVGTGEPNPGKLGFPKGPAPGNFFWGAEKARPGKFPNFPGKRRRFSTAADPY